MATEERPPLLIPTIVLLSVGTALTLGLIGRMLYYFTESVTNVPDGDSWTLLSQLETARHTHDWLTYLLSPYWGQRIYVPRVVFLLLTNGCHLRTLPFLLISICAQAAILVILFHLAFRLFGRDIVRRWLCVLLITHLLLSPLLLEMFLEDIGIQLTIGSAAAIAAIVIFKSAGSLGDRQRFWAAVLLAGIASGCLVSGLLVWPLLLVKALRMHSSVRRSILLCVISATVIVCYGIDYTRPAMGMGLLGILRHPVQALWVTTLVLGGPLTLYSRPVGVIAGSVGLLCAVIVLAPCMRSRCRMAETLSLSLVLLYFTGTALGITAGRISPEWIAKRGDLPILPSRYFAPAFLFWASLLPLAIAYRRERHLRYSLHVIAVSVIVALTFGTYKWQLWMPKAWAMRSQMFDAIASGFFMPVNDPDRMNQLYPNEQLRPAVASFMKKNDLAMFSESRARWIGKHVRSVVSGSIRNDCSAAVTRIGSIRRESAAVAVDGWLILDDHAGDRARDVFFLDEREIIVGLARTLPAWSDVRVQFFGYAKTGVRDAKVLAIDRSAHSCQLDKALSFVVGSTVER
jgi:hypothetical protein